MKLFKRTAALVLGGLLVFSMTACEEKKKEPVNLTLWHVYGGQTDSPLNTLIDRFNQTEGREQGIYVQVTSVSDTNTIHEAVLAAANEKPGAAPLPDLFISYPKTVLALPDETILADLGNYFTEEELEAYIPDFLEEGTVHDRLVVFPAAKSTEVLFVNKIAFDRYAEETGAELDDLRTWEGLFQTASAYTEWTDAKTPEITGDGKPFLAHDYPFNYFQTGTEALGEDFFKGDTLALGSAFHQVWKPYAEAAVRGGVWLQEGYATEPLRTGDAVASVASSASVLYYADTVTHPDNTSEKAEYIALPCPVFEDGKKLVFQRGAGFCILRSEPEREKAAAVFLKWLTEPKQNVEFVTSLGYMPVTQEAFKKYLPDAIENLESPRYRELYRAFLETEKEYEFYTPPQMENYLELETDFEYNTRLILNAAHRAYRESDGTEEAWKRITDDAEAKMKAAVLKG